MSNQQYERARTAFFRAIENDEAKRRPEAIFFYGNACEAALLGLKYDKSEFSRVAMLKQVREWLERAETLKKMEKVSNIPQAPSAILLSKNNDLNEVVGLDHVKQALREAILLPALQPQLFVGNRKPWKGVLLFGPPGTGKTLLASAVSKQAHCSFVSVSSSDIVSKYLGDSERAIKELFEKARNSVKGSSNKRCVIFFDEIDSIGRSRKDNEKESDRRVLTELLKQLDGVSNEDNSKIVFIGATNLPQELDPALRRRFEKRLFVPLPGVQARAQLMAKCLGAPGLDHDLNPMDILTLAKQTKGFSGADIASLCNEILLRPVRLCLKATHFARIADGSLIPCNASSIWARPMKMLDKDFDAKSLKIPLANRVDAEEALKKAKASVNPKELQALADFAAGFGEQVSLFDEENVSDQNKILACIRKSWGPEYEVRTLPQQPIHHPKIAENSSNFWNSFVGFSSWAVSSIASNISSSTKNKPSAILN